MHVSSLQLGIIVAGVALIVAVLVFNWWQLRRAQNLLDTRSRKRATPAPDASTASPRQASQGRVEPTMRASPTDGGSQVLPPDGVPVFHGEAADDPDTYTGANDFPMEIVARLPSDATDIPAAPSVLQSGQDALSAPMMVAGAASGPDAEIEAVARLQAVESVAAGAVAAGLHARLGKRLRWFGRGAADARWQLIASDTKGSFREFAACMLLADRAGAASAAQLETFARVVGEIASLVPAAVVLPDLGAELLRAEALDRLCADLDVQVGLSIRKSGDGSVAGTRLRGVAEAAGFALATGGHFEFKDEETDLPIFALQNMRSEPFSAETLRVSATNGVVLLLDVPRIPDPPRVFDQMKMVGKRLAVTLGGELVDDNRRPLDDAALAAIRQQVEGATEALARCGIEPGSARALALFAA